MKIVQFITRSDTIGGAQKYILETSKDFMNESERLVVVGGGTGEFSKAVEDLNIEYINIKSVIREFSIVHDLKSIFEFRKIILKIDPDVIFIHSAKAGLIGRLALIGLGKNVIFIAHGWSHIRNGNFFSSLVFRLLEKVLSFLSRKIVCISNADLFFAQTKLWIGNEKLELVPTGVVEPEARQPNKISNALNILTVTRFQEPKDFDTLLSALQEVSHLNWRLSVVGDGPRMEFYRNRVTLLGMQDKIRFYGFQCNLDNFYNACDVVVLSSKSEGLPLSLIEAMSFGLPLISSDVGGVSDLIDDGVNGYLVPANDPSTFANSFRKLIEAPQEVRDSFGSASYEKYRQKFSYTSMMTRLKSLL